MTTKPSDFYRHCIRNGHTEMRALTEVLLIYLDEQHAAGQGDYVAPCTCEACTPAVIGSRVFVCSDCVSPLCPKARDHRNKCSRVEGATEAKPDDKVWSKCKYCGADIQTISRFNGLDYCYSCAGTRGAAPIAEQAPGRLDMTACYCPDHVSAGVPCRPGTCPNVPKVAPIAEPPAPVAGEPSGREVCDHGIPTYRVCRLCCIAEPPSPVEGELQPVCLTTLKRCSCVVCMPHWPRATKEVADTYRKERDEALAKVEALHQTEKKARGVLARQAEALTSANARAEALEKQLASERAAHEVTRRAAWLNGQAVGVEDTLRVIMLDRGAKFASHFRPIDSDLTKYPEDIPASPSEPAPVAEPDQPATSVAPTASAGEERGEWASPSLSCAAIRSP